MIKIVFSLLTLFAFLISSHGSSSTEEPLCPWSELYETNNTLGILQQRLQKKNELNEEDFLTLKNDINNLSIPEKLTNAKVSDNTFWEQYNQTLSHLSSLKETIKEVDEKKNISNVPDFNLDELKKRLNELEKKNENLEVHKIPYFKITDEKNYEETQGEIINNLYNENNEEN